ncbi:hypothetical protein T484DRAFT_2022664, partial [Baffinella frigidus]
MAKLASLLCGIVVALAALEGSNVAADGLGASLRPSLRPESNFALSLRSGLTASRTGSALVLRGGASEDVTMQTEGTSNMSALAALGGKEGVTVESLVEHGRAAIGKRLYSEAADFLSAALTRQVEAHGDLADECAELYYLYGSALTMEAEQTDGDSLFGPNVPTRVAMRVNMSQSQGGEEG